MPGASALILRANSASLSALSTAVYAAALTMASGCAVQGFFSFRAARADFFEFLGERGSLRVDRHAASLSLRLPRRFGYGVRRALVLPSRALTRLRLAHLRRPSYDPSFRGALTAFVETIAGGSRYLASLADGVRNLDVIVAAEESSHTGRPVAVHSS